MLDQSEALSLARQRLQQVHASFELIQANHVNALEEFDDGTPGWRVWFRVTSNAFGTFDRPVEVSDTTKEARVVRILL